MLKRTLFAVVIAVALTAPVFAGDIVSMPTGNVVAPGNLEVNGIYWNRPMNTDTMIGELFVGVIDRLELDVLWADVDNADSYFEANAYLTVLKETPVRPSLIVGVTNFTGEDWIGGQQFMTDLTGMPNMGNPDNDDASFFVLSSFNLAAPAVPTVKTPLIRLHVGWGDKYHGEELFGGVQFKIHPQFGGAIMNYQSNPAYMLTYAPMDQLEATAGVFDGDTFFRVGGFFNW